MNRQNRKILTRVKFLVLGIAMLIVTPGGAMQINKSSVMSALVSEQQVDKVLNEILVNKRIERKRRDCSLGIPCTRKVVNYRIGHKKAIALAAMMGLGIKARIN